jgi:O-antigen ligase
VVLAVIAVSLVVDGLTGQESRTWWPRRPSAQALAAALIAEGAVIAVNAALLGQNTAGALAGYLELACFGLATIVVLQRRPALGLPLLMFAAAGAVLGGVSALAGGHALSALRGGLRLSGGYGNPNFLGFALALALPILLVPVIRRSRGWAACALGAAVIVAVMWLTYSRGAAVGAVAGVVTSLALMRPTVRGRLVLAAGLVAAVAVVALVGYPLYEKLRSNADFGAQGAPVAVDRSGWDPNASGPFSRQPSRLSNPAPGELTVTATRLGTGASFPLGPAAQGRPAQIALTVAPSGASTLVALELEDDLAGNGAANRYLRLSSPTRVRLTWRPTADSPLARFFVWLPAGGAVTMSRLRYREAGMPPVAIPTQVRGHQGTANAVAVNEARYVASREDAASLAIRLFAQHLPFGIGWQEFPSYSRARLGFGALATHDEYLRYAAELGLPGILLLIAIGAAVIMACRRVALTDTRIAALGCVAAGAVGLVFINALEVPQLSLPLFLAVALLCTTDGRAQERPVVSRP